MKKIQNGDTQIATERFGDAEDPPLVMIMGATASMLGWPDAQCRALADQGLHLIRFDHRDTGQSTTVAPGTANYAVEDMAHDVIAVLDGYGIGSAHLMGMSLGGYIAQMVVLSYPDHVRSLTLVASEPLGWDGVALPHIAPEFMAHFSGLATLDWTDEDAVAAFLLEIDRLSLGPADVFHAEALRNRIAQVLSRTDSAASMFNHATLTTRDDWTGRYRDITQPTLIIHGTDDPVLPLANGRALADGIAGAQLVALQGTGHAPPDARHARIAAEVGIHIRAAENGGGSIR